MSAKTRAPAAAQHGAASCCLVLGHSSAAGMAARATVLLQVTAVMGLLVLGRSVEIAARAAEATCAVGEQWLKINNFAGPQVLPSLRDLRDETLLRELHKRWQNHNIMIRWLSRFFNYLAGHPAGTRCSPEPT